MLKFEKVESKKKVTGVLLCRDRVAILTGGKDTNAIKALHGAGPMFAESELEGLLRNAIEDGRMAEQVVVGVDPLLEFFSTQRTASGKGDHAPDSLIDELRNKYGGRLIAETVRTALSPKTHQTAIAVPKGELEESSAAFASYAGGKVRFISTSHALYALASDEDPMPKKWTSEIRVFLGQREGLVMFAVEGTLVARQIFEYGGQAQGPIIAAVNGMVAAVQEGLGLGQPDGILFHVGQDHASIAKVCSEITSIDAGVRKNIPYDQATLCLALAFDGFRRRRQGVDFFTHVDTASSEVVDGKAKLPVHQILGLSAVILGMGGYLWQAGSALAAEADHLYADAQAALDLYDGDSFAMEESLDNLYKTVSVAEGFLMERVYWSDIIKELPRILPSTMSVVRIDGRYEFKVPEEPMDDEDGEVAAPMVFDESSRYFELNLKVPMASESSKVPEVAELITALGENDLFKRHFRKIPNPDLSKLEVDGGWQANIVIRLTP